MKKTLLTIFCTAGALTAAAQFLQDLARDTGTGPTPGLGGELVIDGQRITANRQTGEMSASGSVSAVSGVYRFHSSNIRRSQEGRIDFGRQPQMTTCTNDAHHLHWQLSGKPPADWLPEGSFSYQDTQMTNAQGEVIHRALTLHNMWAYWNNIPVLWIPFWYYPFDTNYGWRFLPGYSSRWGGYILSGYVYDIVNEGDPDKYSLGGSTYADYRTENGFALGQTIRWGLKDFGHGKVKVWQAWDDDYNRYNRHWNDHKHNYQHWGSSVERERYRVQLKHEADFTERDALRLQADFYSDSHVFRDFFRREDNHESYPLNELWYEHRENTWATGGSIGGPVNRFYAGTQRLPEGWFALAPQPLWDWPVNYETQTRAGYLNRDAARYDTADSSFASNPALGPGGRGADYQAFRADTQHRLTVPMKFSDVVSFVPRASYRCTYWGDSGDPASGFVTAADNAMSRHIFELGATAAARASGWINDDWRHTFEPYLDYSLQSATLSGSGNGRYYVFDNYDRSIEWLDQFGFEGRGLPHNWHGIRPGIRNFFQKRDDNGVLRTVVDTDFYLAVPFESESYYDWDYRGNDLVRRALRGRPTDDEAGNYNRTRNVIPGFRMRYAPNRSILFTTRAEYDADAEKVAYADIAFRHIVSKNFSWYAAYIGRDYHIYDYLATDYAQFENGNADRWNEQLDNILHFGFTHTVCDWFAWSPFIRHDCRRSEVEEVGLWVDFLTDCLGYRIQFAHEDSYTMIDGARREADDRITFFIYLRALGPGSMLDMMKF